MTSLPHTVQDGGEAWATAQYQSGLKFLADEKAREWEEARPIREASIRARIEEWQAYAANRREWAMQYEADAAQYPKAHKDHHYYLRLAAEQWKLFETATRQIEIERRCL